MFKGNNNNFRTRSKREKAGRESFFTEYYLKPLLFDFEHISKAYPVAAFGLRQFS